MPKKPFRYCEEKTKDYRGLSVLVGGALFHLSWHLCIHGGDCLVDNTPIAMPRNYPSFWSEEMQTWITQEQFMLWYGDVTSLRPTYEGMTFLFQNNNLMERGKNLDDRLYNSELDSSLRRFRYKSRRMDGDC